MLGFLISFFHPITISEQVRWLLAVIIIWLLDDLVFHESTDKVLVETATELDLLD